MIEWSEPDGLHWTFDENSGHYVVWKGGGIRTEIHKTGQVPAEVFRKIKELGMVDYAKAHAVPSPVVLCPECPRKEETLLAFSNRGKGLAGLEEDVLRPTTEVDCS